MINGEIHKINYFRKIAKYKIETIKPLSFIYRNVTR